TAGLYLRVEDFTAPDLNGKIVGQRYQCTVLFLRQRVPCGSLSILGQTEDFRYRMRASPDRVRLALEKDGHDFLMRGEETLQTVRTEIDDLVRFNDNTLAVDKLLDKLKSARTLIDLAEEQCAGWLGGVDDNLPVINANPIGGRVRDFLATFSEK